MRRNTTVAVLTAIITLTGAVAASALGDVGDRNESEAIERLGTADENVNMASVEDCTLGSLPGNRLIHCDLDLTIRSDMAIAIDFLVAQGFSRPEAQAIAGTAVLRELRDRGITINNWDEETT